MSAATIVLITGANRGIGKGLLSAYLSRPNHTVVAAVRNPDSELSKVLSDLPHGEHSKLIILKLDSALEGDPLAAVETLTESHHISSLDIVIANAGISAYFGDAAITPAQEMLEHFQINSVAPLLLFQATLPLLNAAKIPKFITISSGAGSLGMMEKLKNVKNTAYGASKAAANFITRRIHFENPNIIAFPINPGWLQTDLGNHAAKGAGLEQAPMSVEDGVSGLVYQIDEATRDTTSGRFMSSDGKELDW